MSLERTESATNPLIKMWFVHEAKEVRSLRKPKATYCMLKSGICSFGWTQSTPR